MNEETQVNWGAVANIAKEKKKRDAIKPSVTADEISNPPAPVTPPVPQVNTNDGSRTSGLVDNVATNTEGFITAQSEEAKKAKEISSLLGSQTFDGAGVRADMGDQYGLPANVARLNDIQTQLAKANTKSDLNKVNIASGGQGAIQGQRSITLEDRQNAVRTAGLAAEASVLQGNIETASTLINQAMSDYYSDRQLQNQNMITQLNYYSGIADEQTSQLLEKEKRKYEEDQATIKRAQTLVDSAVSSGYLSGDDLQSVLAITDPSAQAEQAQIIIARGIQRQIAEDKANAGFKTPERQNFGTSDNPIWKQFNTSTGEWEDVPGVDVPGTAESSQKTLDQVTFLRDTISRITGGPDPLTGGTYEPLYKSAGANFIMEAGRKAIGSSATNFTRLEAQVDTLKTNALALMTDPNVRKFFGPQMSNADVRLMSSAATTMRPGEQTPAEIKAEAERFDDLFNRMETAVRNGTAGTAQSSARPANIITAPDGVVVEIID